MMRAMTAEPNPAHTALEAIRVKLRGGNAHDVAQTITAEINDIGSAQEILLHAMAAIDACASMAAATIQRHANETLQDPEALYAELKRLYGGHSGSAT